MNKKTKRITVGLVAVLCFLLVFALGFGLTGAWYAANRQASGTVKMDKGILLTFTNLQTLDGTQNDLTNKMAGKLLLSNGDALEDESLFPSENGVVLTLANPTIDAYTGSIDFNVRVKISYQVKYYSAARELDSTWTEDPSDEVLVALFGDTKTGLTMANGWTALQADGYYYLGTAKDALTAVTAGGETHAFFGNDAKLVFTDWTENNDVEFGGPVVNDQEIGAVRVVVDIETAQVGAAAEIWA